MLVTKHYEHITATLGEAVPMGHVKTTSIRYSFKVKLVGTTLFYFVTTTHILIGVHREDELQQPAGPAHTLCVIVYLNNSGDDNRLRLLH